MDGTAGFCYSSTLHWTVQGSARPKVYTSQIIQSVLVQEKLLNQYSSIPFQYIDYKQAQSILHNISCARNETTTQGNIPS